MRTPEPVAVSCVTTSRPSIPAPPVTRTFVIEVSSITFITHMRVYPIPFLSKSYKGRDSVLKCDSKSQFAESNLLDRVIVPFKEYEMGAFPRGQDVLTQIG